MEKVIIEYLKPGFKVIQGDKYSDLLAWDEMLKLVAALTIPNNTPQLEWMKTGEERDAEKETVPGVCSVCGCTWDNACHNPKHGNCWWVNDEQTLCSHCSVPEIKNDPKTEHPKK